MRRSLRHSTASATATAAAATATCATATCATATCATAAAERARMVDASCMTRWESGGLRGVTQQCDRCGWIDSREGTQHVVHGAARRLLHRKRHGGRQGEGKVRSQLVGQVGWGSRAPPRRDATQVTRDARSSRLHLHAVRHRGRHVGQKRPRHGWREGWHPHTHCQLRMWQPVGLST
jgi:hypothetical protein